MKELIPIQLASIENQTVNTVTDQYTGHEHIIEHVLVTPKGLTKLAGKFQQPGGPGNEQFC